MARFYQKPEDEIILEEIKVMVALRATYGYRRITTMVNRIRVPSGRVKINRKRVQRIMQMNGLSIARSAPSKSREHSGKVMTMFPNLRWCSDGMEIRCFNGDKVFVAFSLDCCDREAISYVASTKPLLADDIEELMLKSVQKRFGETLRCPREVQWLSDRGAIYRAKSVQGLSKHLNLHCCYTRAYSPESNGMAEAFVNTFKRDYVYQSDCDCAETVLKHLPDWFLDYNHVAPHSALGMMSPIEYKRSVNL
jgi:putative transposase